MVMGDIHALVSSNAVAGRRIVAFMTEYGLTDLTALADASKIIRASDAQRHQ